MLPVKGDPSHESVEGTKVGKRGERREATEGRKNIGVSEEDPQPHAGRTADAPDLAILDGSSQ